MKIKNLTKKVSVFFAILITFVALNVGLRSFLFLVEQKTTALVELFLIFLAFLIAVFFLFWLLLKFTKLHKFSVTAYFLVSLIFAILFLIGAKKIIEDVIFHNISLLEQYDLQVSANCLDESGKEVSDKNCNEYMMELYNKCDNKNLGNYQKKIFDTKQNTCVDLIDYKTPNIGCDVAECEYFVKYPGFKTYKYSSYKDLYVDTGNKNSNTIIIFAQGGPSSKLELNYVGFLEKDYRVIFVKQTNTLNPYLLKNQDLTITEAKKETEENSKFVNEVYKGLKQEMPNKKFILMGHSMGAFILTDYLSKYENSFDKVIHMGGRLNFSDDFISEFMVGNDALFTYGFPYGNDASTINKAYLNNLLLSKNKKYIYAKFDGVASSKMLVSLGMKNYIKLLKDVNLKNFYVIYSPRDERVGGYSKEELDFLNKKGATLIDAGWNQFYLGHSIMLAEPKFVFEALNHKK